MISPPVLNPFMVDTLHLIVRAHIVLFPFTTIPPPSLVSHDNGSLKSSGQLTRWMSHTLGLSNCFFMFRFRFNIDAKTVSEMLCTS